MKGDRVREQSKPAKAINLGQSKPEFKSSDPAVKSMSGPDASQSYGLHKSHRQ